MTAETAITRFVAGLRYEALPDDVIAIAKRSLVNFFAVAFAGSDTEVVTTLTRQLQSLNGRGSCTIIGRDEHMAPLDAAFINCASANVFDFDDTHLPTIIHPTAPIAAALLAMAEMQPLRTQPLAHGRQQQHLQPAAMQ